MKVVLGADHRGFTLKNFLLEFLKNKNYDVIDVGTYSKEPCDYPDIIYEGIKKIRNKEVERGIFICYTGIGSSIAANKFTGIRAALVYNLKGAKFSRLHNDSNVLILPSFLKKDYVKKIVLLWLKSEFEGGRHLKRIKKIEEIEKKELC